MSRSDASVIYSPPLRRRRPLAALVMRLPTGKQVLRGHPAAALT